MKEMTSNQPYLLRAFFDWILDNELTPYMVINADYPGVQIPTQFINNGQIVLNVSPSACVNFAIDLEWIEFQARFSGQSMKVSFPCLAVAAIYAKENGAGTVFNVPVVQNDTHNTSEDETNPSDKEPSKLSSVPDADARDKQKDSATLSSTGTPSNSKKTKKPKASLRVIK